MERPACKLCFRSFANGRALGGHMRSHVVASAKAAAAAQSSPLSRSSSSSRYEEDEDDVDPKGTMSPGYGLRNNPKRSFRLVDPEYAPGSSSVVVQDVESETESSRPLSSITHRPRSKRARRSAQPEPDSSVSDITTDEDVAISLMLMSRGISNNSEDHYKSDEEEVEEDVDTQLRTQQPVKRRSKYQCGACKKVFKSYQALGGHRASHKKSNGCVKIQIHEVVETIAEKVQHECPICYRVFSSGQALGGHKRSHLVNPTTMATVTSNSVVDLPTTSMNGSVKYGMIDLNLPAPLDEDAELSHVEFVMELNCNY